MRASLFNGVQARSPKATSGDFSSSLRVGEGVPVGAARIRLSGVERPVLTVAGEGGLERRWMAVEDAPQSGIIVRGEGFGLVWPTQAYRVVSWEERGMAYEGMDFVSYVRVKFEPLGREFHRHHA